MALFFREIVRLMFGHQWDAAAPLVPLFCLADAATAITNLITSAPMAVARIDLMPRSELIFQPLRAITIVIAVLWWRSAWACALAYLVTSLLYVKFIYTLKQRCLPSDHQALWHHLRASGLVAVVSLAVPLLISLGAGLQRTVPIGTVPLAAAVAAAITGWMIAILVSRHPLTADRAFQRLTRTLRTFFKIASKTMYSAIALLVTSLVLSLLLVTILIKTWKMHLVSYTLGDDLSHTRKEIKSLFPQIQALLALERKLALPEALPPLRGWAGSPDFLLAVAEQVIIRKPRVTRCYGIDRIRHCRLFCTHDLFGLGGDAIDRISFNGGTATLPDEQ